MRLVTSTRLGLFAVVGACFVVLLTWLGHRDVDAPVVDRHSGMTVEPQDAPAEDAPPDATPYERAIASGSARTAHEILVAVADVDSEHDALTTALAIELLAPSPVETPAGELPRLIETSDAIAWLSGQEIAAATEVEALFAADLPITDKLETLRADALAFDPPDRVAARAAVLLSEGVTEAAPIAARRFRADERVRAELRWWARGVVAAPRDVAAWDNLTAALVTHGHLSEALALLRHVTAQGFDDDALSSRYVNVARWTSSLPDEIAALERKASDGGDVEQWDRLARLWQMSGRPDEALRYAEQSYAVDATTERLQALVEQSARQGRIDAALEHVGQLAEDPAHRSAALDLRAEIALRDMRLDVATAALRQKAELDPSSDARDRLESIFRRAARHADLAELLETRLDDAYDEQLSLEIEGLWMLADDATRAAEVAGRRVARTTDLTSLLAALPALVAADVPGATERARVLVAELPHGSAARANAVEQLIVLESSGHAALVVVVTNGTPLSRELRVRSVEAIADPHASLAAAQALATAHPGDLEILRMLADRASWAERSAVEADARAEILRHLPNDVTERRRLADLLEGTGRTPEAVSHWERLAEQAGPASPDAGRLIAALMSIEATEQAELWIERRADTPGASRTDRHALAELFLSRQHLDRALREYIALAEEDDTDVLALRRTGEVLSWSNDPSGAIPWLERAVESDESHDPELEYLLGEAYWSANLKDEGRDAHEDVLPRLRDAETLTPLREAMVARTLARLDEADESDAIYRRLVAGEPRNQGLRLDHAVSLMIVRRVDEARDIVDAAAPLDPESRRYLRLDGQLLIEENEVDLAAERFETWIALYGDDAGTLSDLGRAHHRARRAEAALDAYDRALALQPENVDVARLRRRVFDRGAHALEVEMNVRDIGDDNSWRLELEGSVPLSDDESRISARLATAHYSGRALAFAQGTRDAEEDVTTLGLGITHPLSDIVRGGIGIDIYDSGRDRRKVGGWSEVNFEGIDPFRTLTLRASRNELFDDPAAAVRLGGTTDAFEAEAHHDIGPEDRWWVAGGAEWNRLEIHTPGRGRVRDRRIVGRATLGHRLRIGEHVVQDATRPRHVPAKREGARVDGEPDVEGAGPAIEVWATYEPTRLRDDQALSRRLPLGTRFDYLTADAAISDYLGGGITGIAQGYVGRDLHGNDTVAGIALAGAWRPDESTEVRFGVTWGRSLGRDDEEDAVGVDLAVTLRW